ncbi:MAG TPA: MoaD/ThiS family protein [Syntrophorhabdaceae bacterium]|nr:MoaD/ThiS family protein [Syntrophorhabdaceae bacterium]HQM80233.1 MoaD/ThiS family protein [Syntrophorhabdaceae bacterium]
MNRVTIELWLWLGRRLEGDFESPSAMRSLREEVVEEGTTVRDLLGSLANRFKAIEQEVFDIQGQRLREGLVGIYSERVTGDDEFYRKILRDGDKVVILPVYTGG